MTTIIHFQPRAELDAEENLRGFVEVAQFRLSVFGPDLDFNSDVWDITDHVNMKGHGRQRYRVAFCAFREHCRTQPTMLNKAFKPFAKAYLRYMQGLRPTKLIVQRLAALRALEAALLENGTPASPCRVNPFILNRACQIIGERFAKTTAYRVGVQLEMLSYFMNKNRLTYVSYSWCNFLPRPRDGVRVGKEFDKRRREKIPSEAVFDALTRIFQLAESPADILMTAVAALLCAAPDRISEVLTLREDCEVFQGQSDGTTAYGLRWWPSKDAQPMIKWIVPSMAPVVQEAIRRVRRVTECARETARWYEQHPTALFLPSDFEHLRKKDFLSKLEITQLFNLASSASVSQFCTVHGIPPLSQGRDWAVKFSDVEASMLKLLPDSFPYLDKELDLRFSSALFVIRRNELHSRRGTNYSIIEPINSNQVNTAFGRRHVWGFSSIFSRFGFTEPDGAPLKVSTHQFRHYLNTLAQMGGMSQIDIAKWSGRKDLRQNETYDHVTPDQMLEMARDAIGHDTRMFGPLANVPKNSPVPRHEFAKLRMPTAHVTELGVCIHDYTMSPCERHRDCIHCKDLVCIKGDAGRAARIREMLNQTVELLRRAEEAIEAGFAGSVRWYEHHKETAARLAELCEAFDNPEIPDGSVLQLSLGGQRQLLSRIKNPRYLK